MSKTKIDWCDEVWNPVTGCSKISEGCKNCYAEKMANRLHQMGCKKYANGFKVQPHENELGRKFPGKGKRIFVNSMSDLFHEDVGISFCLDVLRVILKNPQHTFIILTKRPERMKSILSNVVHIANLWLGVSVENQKAADERIPLLLQTPAALRLVSVEPMLEQIYITKMGLCRCDCSGEFFTSAGKNRYTAPCWRCGNTIEYKGINWVICGCESGANRRPFNVEWARSLRNQCISAGVPFFLKQMPFVTAIEHLPLLDGERWNQMPGVNR